jgi:hypothetical protein
MGIAFSSTDKLSSTPPKQFADTVVVPAKADTFEQIAIAQQCWHHIKIHKEMLPRIKYLAIYQVAPISAITHLASVSAIEPWEDPRYYVLYFSEPLKEIPAKKLQGAPPLRRSRYTTLKKIMAAQCFDEVFD